MYSDLGMVCLLLNKCIKSFAASIGLLLEKQTLLSMIATL